MSNRIKQRGVTLIELMIAVGIVGVLASIGFPIYTDYVETARLGAMAQNMESIRLFEEEERLADGAYAAGTYDPDDPDNVAGLKTLIGWDPRTSTDEITYVVDNVTTNGFRVTATHSDGTELERTFSR